MRLDSARPRFAWTYATALVATVLYVAALRNDFYQLTSPSTLSWHVVLRKAYSIAAFAAVGILARRAQGERGSDGGGWPIVLGLAGYSGAIEIGQYRLGSTEGLVWNVVDIACGALGGALGTVSLRAAAKDRRRSGEPATDDRS